MMRRLKPFAVRLRRKIIFGSRYLMSFIYPPVVVYSMGKVASRAVHATLSKAHLPNPVFHVHYLSVPHIEEVELVAKNSGWRGSRTGMVEGKSLRRLGDLTWGRSRWKVVSLVREPVAREISDLFQNLHHFPHLVNLTEDALVSGAISELQNALANFDEDNDYAATWFDREVKDVFGFDVYDAAFDPAIGYAIYQAQHADILILRLEDLSDCASDAFRQFLGIKDFKLLKVNEGLQKSYKDAYQLVLERISFSEHVLNRVYNTRYARHFYTSEELAAFKQRWMKEAFREIAA